MTRASRSRGIARATLLAAGLLANVPATAAAASAVQVPVGPRAIALGGAFVSLADDATALYWNPAGLVSVGHQEFTASHADLFGTGIRDNFAAFVVPLSPGLAAATDWYHSGFDDGSLGFRENRVDAGFGVELRPRLFAGVNAKLLTRSLDFDATNLGSSRGLGFDAGLLCSPGDAWRLGLTAQDVFGTRVRDADGSSSLAYPRALRFGAAWNWRRMGTVTAQVDDRWHLGLEGVPATVLAVRLGAQGDRRDSEGATWSCGLGLKTGILRVDWAREFPPTLASTDHFAAAFEFNFNPPLIRVERPKLDDLYASLQRSYAIAPIGSLRVRNLKDKSIETTVSVFIPEFMDRPSEQLEVLRPGAVKEIPLRAVLGERVLSLRGDRTVQVQVTASYASRRLVRKERVSGTTVAYAPGAIDWSRGMAQAAAFVTPRDPAVETLARAAARTLLDGRANGFPSRNLALMAAMVDALATVGVAYVPDPQNPFASVAEKPHAVDTIYYPAQTLQRRTGDCDDTTVLLASLLASVGVPTRFVDAPGHILLVAGTGVDETNAAGLGVDSTLFVVLDHEVWVPLETTVASRGFLESWRAGSEQLVNAREPDRFIDVTEAQARYEPALPSEPHAGPALDERRLAERLDEARQGLTAWRDEHFRALFGGRADELQASAEATSDIVRVHFEAGDLAGARRRLESALGTAPQSALLHHGLGVVLVGQDSLEAAESHFRAALAFSDAPAATWLDLGLVRWLRGDTASATELIVRAARRAGGVEPVLALLGEPDGAGAETLARLRALVARVARAQPATSRPDAIVPSVPRLAPLPSGARSADHEASAAAWGPHLAWWP